MHVNLRSEDDAELDTGRELLKDGEGAVLLLVKVEEGGEGAAGLLAGSGCFLSLSLKIKQFGGREISAFGYQNWPWLYSKLYLNLVSQNFMKISEPRMKRDP